MRVNDRHVSFYYENDMDIGKIEIDPKKTALLVIDMQHVFITRPERSANPTEAELREIQRWEPFYTKIDEVVVPNNAKILKAFREKGMSLAIIGPKSSTWTRGYEDPAEWTELFDPDLICTADRCLFRKVRFDGEVCTEEQLLIREQHLSVNGDYPRTIPRGGTGYGVIKGLRVEG